MKKITSKKTEKKDKPKKAVRKPRKPVEEKPIAEKEAVKVSIESEAEGEAMKTDRYYNASGRRKTSVARIRVWTKGDKTFSVNQMPLEKYFPTIELQRIVKSPLELMNTADKFRISVVVSGGGMHSQAEAIRHGITRALVLFNPNFRKRLKKAGYLTRDPRAKERKKFGLKRARRAPQWAKR